MSGSSSSGGNNNNSNPPQDAGASDARDLMKQEKVKQNLNNAGVSEEEGEEMMKYAWLVARILKAGFDNMPTLVYNESWVEDTGNPEEDWKQGVANWDMYRDLQKILYTKAYKEYQRNPSAFEMHGATPQIDLPVPTPEDFADVLEMYADNMEVSIIEMAFSDMNWGMKLAIAGGKTIAQKLLFKNHKVRDDLTYHTEEVAVASLMATCQIQKYRNEMLPILRLVQTHPRLLAWVCRFIRYYFKLESDYLNQQKRQAHMKDCNTCMESMR